MSSSKKNAKESVKTGTKKKNRYLLKYFLLLVIAGIIGFVIASVKYFGKDRIKRNSSLTIEFTYDGAAHNLTPSGEQFSIGGIMDDRILEEALAKTNLSEKYTPESIRNSLNVSGQYPDDVIAQIKDYDSLYDFSESRQVGLNDYYPTIYLVKLYDDFDPNVSDTTMNSLLGAIAESYKTYFIGKYTYVYGVENYDSLLTIDGYDYSQRVKILNYRMNVLEKYAGEMFAKNTNFKSKGMSFNDLLLKCRALRSDSLGNVEATVMTDVLTVSAERLKNQYEYEIKLLENEKTYKTFELADLNSLIESYEMDGVLYIPSGDAIVKVDNNSQATYEKLMDKKKEVNEKLVNIDSDIERYKLYLTDLGKAAYSSSVKIKTITEKLTSIGEKLSELENVFKEMLEAYNKTIIDEDAVLVDHARNSKAKLLSGGFILNVIKCAGPLCIIVMIICALHAAWYERKIYKATIE